MQKLEVALQPLDEHSSPIFSRGGGILLLREDKSDRIPVLTKPFMSDRPNFYLNTSSIFTLLGCLTHTHANF